MSAGTESALDRATKKKKRIPRMHEMMDYQTWKQRHEEMLHEVEFNRRAKALRAIGKRRAVRRAALVWEIKRHAGRLLKLLRALRNAG
jgi:aminoglycoside phosphotransferase family enzyme